MFTICWLLFTTRSRYTNFWYYFLAGGCNAHAYGRYAEKEACNQFVFCAKGRGYVFQCNYGTNYNPFSQQCESGYSCGHIPGMKIQNLIRSHHQARASTILGPAFESFARPENSRAWMPKIKVDINRLKWNFAWVIISIKIILDPNFEADSSSTFGRREQTNSAINPGKNWFNFKKKWAFMSWIVIIDQKLTLNVNFSNFQAKEFFHFQFFFSPFCLILLKFAQNMS